MSRATLFFAALIVVISGCTGISQETQAPLDTVVAAPANEDYLIGTEDILHISVWKDETLTTDAMVRSDGKISVPLINDVPASGLTVLQLKHDITSRLKEYIPGAEVTVVVKEMRSNKVYIQGEVNKPGPQVFNGELTVIQALSLAGGLTPYAKRSAITILRADGSQLQFNYKEVVRGRRLEQNVILQRGDTLIVP